MPHERHGRIPFWKSPSLGPLKKDGAGRSILGPGAGSSLFRSDQSKEVGLCGNFIPVPHVLDTSEKTNSSVFAITRSKSHMLAPVPI